MAFATVWVFQSAPANYGGRIPRRGWSATGSMGFQSAPANYGGRILGRAAPKACMPWFQSAPANYGGRIRDLLIALQLCDLFQSAPANYGGRIPRSACSPQRAANSFNPRPPITAGESDMRDSG